MQSTYDQTPPDTATVKQQLLKQRSAISEAHQEFSLNAYATASPLDTPMMVPNAAAAKRTGGVAFVGVPDTPSQGPTPAQLATDILLYTNPALTYAAAAGGALVLGMAWFAMRGAHGLTLLSGLSYLLLADLALNFLRSLVSREWQEAAGWAGSDWAAAAAERAAAVVAALARLHDAYLLCRDPTVALRVAAGLWALALAGRYLSVWGVATLAFAAAFTLPAAYMRHREGVQSACANARRNLRQRWDALGLTRKQMALVLGLVLGCLWLRSGWASRLSALLVGALAVRCQLKPAEVERIRTIAEPYTQSVRKRASRISIYAHDLALRTATGKAHAR